MTKKVFSKDQPTSKELTYAPKLPIDKWAAVIPAVKEGVE